MDAETRSTLIERLRTVVAITITPFDSSNQVDESAYSKVLRRMANAGITAFTPNGNTGEFYSLDAAELRTVVELAAAELPSDALLVPGVGLGDRQAATMARDAAAAGAPAVMVHQPVHPYRSVQGWIDYHRRVADAVPGVGLVSYVRDPRFDAAALEALACACPELVGVKYAIPDPIALTTVINRVGPDRLAWICGLAERWAPFAWVAGARGFTSGLVNVAPELALRLLNELRAGEMTSAMKTWQLVAPMEELRARGQDANNVSAIKEALAQLGTCNRAVRPPITELSIDDRAAVEPILSSWSRISATA
jgi:4-hydroxy-tetrahydrodipicolinate synthase